MPRIRLSGVLSGAAFLFLFLLSINIAQGSEPIDRNALTQHVRPTSGGWFQSQGNLGNINFDISDSGVAAGNWSTYKDGKAIWYYFQGEIRYPSYAESNADGVIAIAESPLYEVVTGGACLTCPLVPPVFAQGGTLRIEFTSARTAHFIHNGTTTIPIVAWLQGLPLVAKRDYSGEWMAVIRQKNLDANLPTTRFETVVTATLTPLDFSARFEAVPDSSGASGLLDMKTADRRYRFTCVEPDTGCTMLHAVFLDISPPCSICAPYPRDFFTLFLKDDDTGQFLAAAESSAGYRIHDDGLYWKAYGSSDKILIRYIGADLAERGNPPYALEILMIRLPTGLFHTARPEVSR
jgi:hypothetical protein